MADMTPQGTQENGVLHGHEGSDANVRSSAVAVAILLSSVLVVMLAMSGLFKYLENRAVQRDAATPQMFKQTRSFPPDPPLLPSPRNEQTDKLPWAVMEEERRADEKTAAQIGLIDAKTGRYTIPSQGLFGAAQNETSATGYSPAHRARWEEEEHKLTVDSSGGRALLEPNGPQDGS